MRTRAHSLHTLSLLVDNSVPHLSPPPVLSRRPLAFFLLACAVALLPKAWHTVEQSASHSDPVHDGGVTADAPMFDRPSLELGTAVQDLALATKPRHMPLPRDSLVVAALPKRGHRDAADHDDSNHGTAMPHAACRHTGLCICKGHRS